MLRLHRLQDALVLVCAGCMRRPRGAGAGRAEGHCGGAAAGMVAHAAACGGNTGTITGHGRRVRPTASV